MNDQVLNSFSNAKKVLIVPKPEVDLDAIASAFALALAYRKSKTKVSLYIPPEVYTQTLKSKFPPQNMKFLSKHEPGSYVITVNNLDSEIKEIKWKEKEGKVNIYLTTDTEEIPREKIKINRTDGDYDLTILIGFTDVSKLEDFSENHSDFFSPEKTIALGVHTEQGSKFQSTALVGTTYSETVMQLIRQSNFVFDANIATNLLAGVYWKTNSFKTAVSQATFDHTSLLMQAGADDEKAKNIALRTISFAGSKYFSDVYANIKTGGDGIFYSIVPDSKFSPGATRKELFNTYVPLSEIIDCRVAFIVLHTQDDSNTVYLQSNFDKFKLKPLLDKYNGQGDAKAGIFKTNLNVSKLEKELVEDIRKLINEADQQEKILPEPKEQELPQMFTPPIHDQKQEQTLESKIDSSESKLQPETRLDLEQQSLPATTTLPLAEKYIDAPVSPPTPEPITEERPEIKMDTGVAPQPMQLPVSTSLEPITEEIEPIKPTSIGDDPLAPATALPEALDLEGNQNKEKPKPETNTPLPPAD